MPIRIYASCAALHEIVQPNQIADRGNVTYAHIPPPIRYHMLRPMCTCTCTCMYIADCGQGRNRFTVVIMSLQEYIEDAATSQGITTLKTEQQEAIRQFVLGRDVFVSLPTGYMERVSAIFPSRSCSTV